MCMDTKWIISGKVIHFRGTNVKLVITITLYSLAHKLLCHLGAVLSLFLTEVLLVAPTMSWLRLFQGVITLDVKKFLFTFVLTCPLSGSG